MTAAPPEPAVADTPVSAGPSQLGSTPPFPRIQTALSTAQVRERLGAASRRGRLPGYQDAQEEGLFRVAAFGHPFDGYLTASARAATSGTLLEFALRLARRGPALFAASLMLTVWPGVYFMDQLMIQFLPGVRDTVATAWWYLPLTILPSPWAWAVVVRKSRHSARDSAQAAIRKIAFELDGDLIDE